MTNTPRSGAPDWAAAQASPWLTENERARRIEAGAGRFPVADRVTAPPGTCADGASYIVIATATGAFAGKEGQIATAAGANAASGWLYRVLGAIDEGVLAYVQDEDAEYKWSGSAWAVAGLGGYGVSNDTTLADSSATDLVTEHAVKGYIDNAVIGLFDYKGTIDCSANPNYPSALKGDAYRVSVAGKIGGGSGTSVDAGDWIICEADNAGGTQAAVGASWSSIEHNGVFGAGGSGSITASGYTQSTAKLLGRSTAAAGPIEEIAVGAGLSLAGGTLSRSAPSVQSVTSAATVTPTFSDDQVNITAQATGLTLANPTGTAVDCFGMAIRIKDNGTARSITFGSQYRAIGVTLPTTTVISKTLYLGLIFNNADTKWDVVAVAQEA